MIDDFPIEKIDLAVDSPLLKDGFLFGCATAAFQIEGGTRVDGREDSIWDTFCRKPGVIRDHSNGDTACDHRNLWSEDLDLLSSLGFDAYRFSISWPRVVKQDGTSNQEGIAFYERLVDGLLDRGVSPFVTLYHWDLPQYLEDKGGWLNRDTAYRFADYAEKITSVLGDRVPYWVTLNEPWVSAFLGYAEGIHAPGLKDRAASLTAAYHLMLGHGLGSSAIRAAAGNSQVGIVLNPALVYPRSDSADDRLAAERLDAETNGLFFNLLFGQPMPEVLFEQNPKWYPATRVADRDLIAASNDFIGINYYTRSVVSAASNQKGYLSLTPAGALLTDMGWEVYPEGLFELLKVLNKRWPLPPIFITENGAAFPDSAEDNGRNDILRQQYLIEHLNGIEKAILGGIDVRGWMVWSLIDNFEWAEGYTKRFGIVYVDYVTQERTKKGSAFMLERFLMKRRAS